MGGGEEILTEQNNGLNKDLSVAAENSVTLKKGKTEGSRGL